MVSQLEMLLLLQKTPNSLAYVRSLVLGLIQVLRFLKSYAFHSLSICKLKQNEMHTAYEDMIHR